MIVVATILVCQHVKRSTTKGNTERDNTTDQVKQTSMAVERTGHDNTENKITKGRAVQI
jgi:hypothetical protein